MVMHVKDAAGGSAPLPVLGRGDGSGAAVEFAQKAVDRGVLPNDLSETNWLMGDASAGLSVAASATEVSSVWDVSKIRRDYASIAVVVAGTGTVSLATLISRDGSSDVISLAAGSTGTVQGSNLTNLAAGIHWIMLDDVAIPYGHKISFSVLETGGAAAAVVSIFGMGRNG